MYLPLYLGYEPKYILSEREVVRGIWVQNATKTYPYQEEQSL